MIAWQTDGTKLVWRQDNVPWDFSNPDGYLVNTTLSAETVGQEMWDNLRSGNAYVHLFGFVSMLPQSVNVSPARCSFPTASQ